jgi:signal transduction histidine kinase
VITYEHLQELQRFAELGRMSASLLHEISNPLTAALINLELSDERSANVRRQSKTTVFAVQPQLDQLKRVLMPLARKACVQLDIGLSPSCRLRGDPVKFQHIISNLVVNAIEACDKSDGSGHSSHVRLIFTQRGNYLVIQVTDRGKGISAEALPHIFETFYTTKGASGRGIGLGLAIIQHYVTADFHGTITATSSKRTGTCFTVKLPILIP